MHKTLDQKTYAIIHFNELNPVYKYARLPGECKGTEIDFWTVSMCKLFQRLQ